MTVVSIVTGCLCIINITAIFVFIKWMCEALEGCDKPEEIKIKIIESGKLPQFKTDGAVCADCYARTNNHFIKKSQRELIPLGFALELPEGYEAVVRPRSGLTKDGIDIGIGTIDFDYRGEVMACVINNSEKDFPIHNGDRICQIAIREVPKNSFKVVEELSETERGSKGFGSSGIK